MSRSNWQITSITSYYLPCYNFELELHITKHQKYSVTYLFLVVMHRHSYLWSTTNTKTPIIQSSIKPSSQLATRAPSCPLPFLQRRGCKKAIPTFRNLHITPVSFRSLHAGFCLLFSRKKKEPRYVWWGICNKTPKMQPYCHLQVELLFTETSLLLFDLCPGSRVCWICSSSRTSGRTWV